MVVPLWRAADLNNAPYMGNPSSITIPERTWQTDSYIYYKVLLMDEDPEETVRSLQLPSAHCVDGGCLIALSMCVGGHWRLQVTVAIVSGNVNYGPRGPETAFAIDANTGDLTMLSFISYEDSTRFYSLTLNLTNHGPLGPVSSMSTVVQLNITIASTNTNARTALRKGMHTVSTVCGVGCCFAVQTPTTRQS